jgi:serine/threonine protein kinase
MVLLTLASTQFEVCVAVFTEVAQADHLFSMNFHDSVHLEEQVLRLGRALEVLHTCLAQLKTYYTDLKTNEASLNASDVHLPSPVSAEQPSQQITTDLNLRFLYKLSRGTGLAVDSLDSQDWRENTQHGVFVALGGGRHSIPEGREIIVKFARRYNTTAHEKLAGIGLAPELYYHCSVRGGLTMIVMEKVQGITASLWKAHHPGTRLPDFVIKDVERAIKALHEIDIVFGDLRLQNIMVCEHDKAHAVLVDFDWAETAGKGRYPATISDLRAWAPTVEPYGVMEKEHDLHRLQFIPQEAESA